MKLFELNPAMGGPILKDKLWFFGSGKYSEVEVHPAGATYWRTGEPGYTNNKLHNVSGRVTWQATPRNKISGFIDRWFRSQDHTTAFTAGADSPPGVDWETATSTYPAHTSYLSYLKWTSPVTNRLLVETGFTWVQFPTEFGTPLPGIVKPYGSPEWYAGALRRDLVLNTFVGQATHSGNFAKQPSLAFASAVSYVTGSHTVKTGIQYRYANSDTTSSGANAHLTQQYRSGVADSVLVYGLPHNTSVTSNDFAFFAMDSWAIRRFTLNYGGRMERFSGHVNPVSLPAGRFVSERNYPKFSPVNPLFFFSPRLSAVYDLFGTAKTALKFSASKYMTPAAVSFFNPFVFNSGAADTRIWLDRDLIPGTSTVSGVVLPTNGDNIAQDNEIGPSSNRRFGLAPLVRADPDLTREHSWDYSASVQHEVLDNLSVTVGWYWARTYNAQQTINVLRTGSDYTPFRTPNPYNPAETLTLFRLDPTKVGVVDNVVTNSDVNHRDYQAYEASVTSRLRGGIVNFGWAMERNRRVTCDTPSPNDQRFCDQTGELFQELGQVAKIPYRHEFKLSVSQPIAYGFNVGASVISFAGNALGPLSGSVAWAVPANIFPVSRTEVVSVPLASPGTVFLSRWNQVDISVRRNFKVRRIELRPALELYNVMNSAVVLGANNNFGSSLLFPQTILQGRFAKLTMLVKF